LAGIERCVLGSECLSQWVVLPDDPVVAQAPDERVKDVYVVVVNLPPFKGIGIADAFQQYFFEIVQIGVFGNFRQKVVVKIADGAALLVPKSKVVLPKRLVLRIVPKLGPVFFVNIGKHVVNLFPDFDKIPFVENQGIFHVQEKLVKSAGRIAFGKRFLAREKHALRAGEQYLVGPVSPVHRLGLAVIVNNF